MPLYTFELHDGERSIGDETGVWFADREGAIGHAHDVARELMSARELQTRTWRLCVYEDGARVIEIPFASVDVTLDRRNPTLRSSIARWRNALRDFKETMSTARATARGGTRPGRRTKQTE